MPRPPICRPGVDLVREGEDGDALFVILEGEAAVQHEGAEVARVGSRLVLR